jgi:hypothetical protein
LRGLLVASVIGVLLCFGLGLAFGVSDRDPGASITSFWLLTVVAPAIVVATLVAFVLWRGVSHPIWISVLLGAAFGAAWVTGLFFSVSVTDETLSEYGSDEGWESLLGFQLMVFVSAGGSFGFVTAWVIRIAVSACSWLISHVPRTTPNGAAPL